MKRKKREKKKISKMDKKDARFIAFAVVAISVILILGFLYTSEITITEIVGHFTCIHADDYCSRYDVNTDGQINFVDSGQVWIHRTEIEPYDKIYDMDCDGDVDYDDAMLVHNHWGCMPIDGPCNC